VAKALEVLVVHLVDVEPLKQSLACLELLCFQRDEEDEIVLRHALPALTYVYALLTAKVANARALGRGGGKARPGAGVMNSAAQYVEVATNPQLPALLLMALTHEMLSLRLAALQACRQVWWRHAKWPLNKGRWQ
jgi:hypothetical protein